MDTVTILFVGISVTFGSIFIYYSFMTFYCDTDDDEYENIFIQN
jgi:hypothetical protein